MSGNGLVMTDQEIVEYYRRAKNGKSVLGRLAKLNGLEPDRAGRKKILNILVRNNVFVTYSMGHLTEGEKARRLELYHQGLSDSQIAGELGIASSTVYMWRKKEGLPANAKPGGQRKTDVNAQLVIEEAEPDEAQEVQAAAPEPEEVPEAEPKLKKDRVVRMVENLLKQVPPRPSPRVQTAMEQMVHAVEQLANALMADWLEGEWTKNAPADEG